MERHRPDYGQWKLLAVLAGLGLVAQLNHVHIPHTDVLIDGRWAFGFMGFALLRRWWMALLLAVCLSTPWGSDVPFGIGFAGNFAYVLPALVLIRVLHEPLLRRWGTGWAYGLAWLGIVLLCYQAFTTPIVWGVVGLLQGAPVPAKVMEGWRTQPFLVESFLVAGFSALGMVAYLSHAKLRSQQKRMEHVNRLLLGIRNVNQMIIAEDDPRRLIERACVNLTETVGYLNVWIALLGGESAPGLGLSDTGSVAASAAAGFDGGFKILRERLERGEFPDCMNRALKAGGIHVVAAPAVDCPDCPLHTAYGGRAGLVRRLEFDGVTYGVLTASVPAAYARDAEEQNLFEEVAGDLAFALHKIEAARDLDESRMMLERTESIANVGSWQWDIEQDRVRWSAELFRIFGRNPERGSPTFAEHEALYVAEDMARLRQAVSACASEGTPYELELRAIRSDGEIRYCVARGRPLPEADGKIRRLVGSLQDITDRKQAEEALRESESRVRAKLDALLDPEGDLETLELADVVDCDQIQSLMDDFHALTDIGVGIIDLEGNVLVGTGWQEVCTTFHRVHPETARNCIESDTLLASDVEPGTFKVYKCKNNMWDMVTPIMVGERHLGNLFLGQFLFEHEEPNVDVFREQARQYGFDEEAYLKAYRSIPRWSRQTVDAVMTFYCNLIGVISRLSYAHIKLARASEALRRSEQKFRSFVENANDMVYALSPEGVFTYMSPNWLEFIGEPAEEAIGKSFEPYVHPEDVHLCYAFLEKTLRTGEKQRSVEYRVRYRDGSWRWHVSNGSPVRDESGTVTGFVGIARDVTEEKRAEEALKASEARFKNMLRDVTSVAVQGYALDGTVRYWNQASETFYGYTVEEALGRNLLDLIIPPAMRDGVRAQMRRMAETGEAMPAGELELMQKDGSPIHAYSSHALVQLPGQEPELFCIDIDLTERKRSEQEREKLREQLAQAQKMESIGRLAGGVAHDFNNMLQTILGYCDMLLAEAGSGHPFRESLEEIRNAGRRSADLTRQLLAFARKQTIAPVVLDLNAAVSDLLKMLARLIGEDADLLWQPCPGTCLVNIDPVQIDQILANLVINSRDAIRGNGRIAIETGHVEFDEDYCGTHPGFREGRYEMLAVSDDGVGMDRQTLEKVFEPFFTTKGKEKGTGLGLATVYGIVKQNDGFVNVYSEPGQGTTVRIYLPAATEGIDSARRTERQGDLPTGAETVLLVEDEPALLRLSRQVLEELGYTVWPASGPQEALSLAAERLYEFDVLITDVVMPQMSGRELQRQLAEHCPGLRCIFMSGYTENVIAHQGVLEEGVHFLQKPFSTADLARKLWEVLTDAKDEG